MRRWVLPDCLLLFFQSKQCWRKELKNFQSRFNMKVRYSVHYIQKNLLYCTIVTDVWGSREVEPYFHLLPQRQCSISACHVSKTYQTTKLDLTHYILSACLLRLGTYALSIHKSIKRPLNKLLFVKITATARAYSGFKRSRPVGYASSSYASKQLS